MAENDSDREQEYHEEAQPPPVKKKQRGPTKLSKVIALTVEHKKKNHLELDAKNRPKGPTAKPFSSYLGTVARNRVDITINEWKHVNDDVKQQCWLDVYQYWDVPDTKDFKEFVWQKIAKRFSEFKYNLAKDYIFGGSKMGEDPCLAYPNIEPEKWNEFVKYRTSEAFKELSKKQAEIRAQNQYNHTMSRGGYDWMTDYVEAERQKKWEEQRKSMEAESSSTVLEPLPDLQRHVTWAAARRKRPTGKYTSDKAEAVANRINELEEQSSQGSWTPQDPRMDILATSLGRLDNPSRVVGVSGRVGAKEFFGPKKRVVSRPKMSTEELDAMVNARVDERMDERESQWQMRFEYLTSQLEALQASQRTTSTMNEPSAPDPLDDYHEECYLHLDEPCLHPVAKALKYPNHTTIHNRSIRDDQVKVTVISVIKGQEMTCVPFRTKEVTTLGQAMKGFIVWPKRLVFDTAQEAQEAQPPILLPQNFNGEKYPYLNLLWTMQPGFERNLSIPAGVVNPLVEEKIWLQGSRDVKEFLMMEELEQSWLDLAVWYCHSLCQRTPKEKFCRFLCPSRLAYNENALKLLKKSKKDHFWEMQSYVELQMGLDCGTLYFAPVLNCGHWALAILCPKEFKIFWFDSLQQFISDDHRKVFHKGILKWHDAQDTDYYTATQTSIHVINVKCPSQRGSTECGYYVCKYMLDIVYQDQIKQGRKFQKLLEGLYGLSTDSFKQDEDIDFVRNALAEFLITM